MTDQEDTVKRLQGTIDTVTHHHAAASHQSRTSLTKLAVGSIVTGATMGLAQPGFDENSHIAEGLVAAGAGAAAAARTRRSKKDVQKLEDKLAAADIVPPVEGLTQYTGPNGVRYIPPSQTPSEQAREPFSSYDGRWTIIMPDASKEELHDHYAAAAIANRVATDSDRISGTKTKLLATTGLAAGTAILTHLSAVADGNEKYTDPLSIAMIGAGIGLGAGSRKKSNFTDTLAESNLGNHSVMERGDKKAYKTYRYGNDDVMHVYPPSREGGSWAILMEKQKTEKEAQTPNLS